MYAVQTERNVVRARTHVGEVKALLGLALEYGSVSADEFERVMAQLAHVRPELFRDEPDDIFSRLAARFRRLLVYGAPLVNRGMRLPAHAGGASTRVPHR